MRGAKAKGLQVLFSDQGLLDGTFELDCPGMAWTEAGETVSGAGYFRQSPRAGFEFALFSGTPGDPKEWFRRLAAQAKVPAGTLLPRESGGEIRAIDVTGQEWTADRLKIDRTVSRSQIVKGTARELQTSEKMPDGAPCLVEVRISGSVQFPPNLRSKVTTTLEDAVIGSALGPAAANVELDVGRLEVRSEGGGVSLRVLSNGPLRPETELRVVDALRFLENSLVPWCSLARWEKGRASFRLRGDRYERLPQFALPPLPEDEQEAYWRLFQRLVDRPESSRVDLRLWIDVTSTAAAWPLESRGLPSAIAVEAMAADLLPCYEPGLAGYTEEDERRAREAIVGTALPERLERRLLGLLTSRGASPSDRLFELARLGVASQAEVQAWKALRHPIAHGSLPPMGQDLVDQVHSVRTLFNRLLFTAVGYDGPYVDYGSRGWPTRQHSAEQYRSR